MQETLWHLVAATLIGFAVGLERERARAERATSPLGGVRTFTLIGLLGGISVLGKEAMLVPLGFLAVAGLGLWSFSRGRGATSEVSALIVYSLGVLSGMGLVLPALFAGTITLGFLAFREEIHDFVGGLNRDELEAGLLLVLLLGAVYPLLPDANYGPFGVWNPREIWRVVILVAGVNFAGYLALKALGSRGLWAAALLGGLVSSTVVTLSMASKSRSDASRAPLWASGVVLASEIMLLRILLWSGIVAPVLFQKLLLPALVWLGFGLVSAFWFSRHDQTSAEAPKMKSPLQLGAALGFAFTYALVKLLARGGLEAFGNAGVYVVGLFSGLINMDATTLSFARLTASREIVTHLAAVGVLLAAFSNTVAKIGLSFALGGAGLGRLVLIGLFPGALVALVLVAIAS